MAEMTNKSVLLSPFDLRGLRLKNRVVMAPLTRSRAGEMRLPNALMAEYYAQRAAAGLIITEATVISKQGIGWLNSPGIYTDEQAEAWKKLVDVVHARGTPIFLQLWHCGRASHSSFHDRRELPVAPSAIKIKGDPIHTPLGKQPYETPRALKTDEIPQSWRIIDAPRRGPNSQDSTGWKYTPPMDISLISSCSPRLISGLTAMGDLWRTVTGSWMRSSGRSSASYRLVESGCAWHPTAISMIWGHPIFARLFLMWPNA